MKKLYNANKSTKSKIHPSPPSPLSALPAALLTLATALSADEQEVLSYLLGCQKPIKNHQLGRKKAHQNHPPELCCPCFTCYKSFWARWDSSPNRHVIHLIIDGFEESLVEESKGKKKKKNNKNKRGGKKKGEVFIEEEEQAKEVVDKIGDAHHDDDDVNDVNDDDDDDDDEEAEEGKSNLRRFVSWVFGMSN